MADRARPDAIEAIDARPDREREPRWRTLEARRASKRSLTFDVGFTTEISQLPSRPS